MKNELHYLRHSLAQHRRFIQYMRKRASVYGSDFSGSVEVDCEAFLRDLPPLKNSTHTVITKAFLKRIMNSADRSDQTLIRIGCGMKAELAAERARLDWLESNADDIMKYNCRSYIWFPHQNLRAAIDAGMKEGA